MSNIVDYFEGLHQKEDLERPLLDNLDFNNIGEERAKWSEREFEKEEVRLAVFSVAGDKPRSGRLPNGFFPVLLGDAKGRCHGVHGGVPHKREVIKRISCFLCDVNPEEIGSRQCKRF